MTTEEKNIDAEEKSTSTEEKMENKVVLMDFFAEWCGPCKLQDPIIEKLKEKFGDKVEFKKIDVDRDVDDGRSLTERYSIHAIPTIIVEKNGKFFAKFVGVTSQHVLEKKIKEIVE